jgi:hypothetical protein
VLKGRWHGCDLVTAASSLADNGPDEADGPNPFGYADHTPFAGFGIELIHGRREDGSIVHVSEVPSGRRCDCVCPACEKILVARKGPKKAHHFGHYGKGNGCGRASETNAHIWAKAVLERELRIMLPAVGARVGMETHTRYPAGIFKFASARLERALDDIVPDVILTTAKGDELLVEVRVTHACGPEKIAKLRDRALPTVEVNLSAWRTSQDREAIENALIETAEREWLYNRKVDEAAEQLLRDIEKRSAQKAARDRIAAEKAAAAKMAREAAEARRLKRDVDRLLARARSAAAHAERPSSNLGMHEHLMLGAVGDDYLLLPNMHAIGFCIPAERWQGLLVDEVINAPFRDHQESAEFSVSYMLQILEPCIDPAFRVPPALDVTVALAARTNDALLPGRAIKEMFEHLCMQGYLTGWDDHYEYADQYARHLETAHKRWKEEERRRQRLNLLIANIVDTASLDEFEGFDLDAWRAGPIQSFEMNIDTIVGGDDELWRRCDGALTSIFNMLHGGPVAEDLLGLPLGAAQVQARERIAAAEAAAARGRETCLRNSAAFDLEEDAAAWLQTPGADGMYPLALARRDDRGLKQALALLEPVAKARLERITIERRIQGFQSDLHKAAMQGLGLDLAATFMRNYDARLESSPFDHCIDSYRLQACLSVLDGWIARHQKSRRLR